MLLKLEVAGFLSPLAFAFRIYSKIVKLSGYLSQAMVGSMTLTVSCPLEKLNILPSCQSSLFIYSFFLSVVAHEAKNKNTKMKSSKESTSWRFSNWNTKSFMDMQMGRLWSK